MKLIFAALALAAMAAPAWGQITQPVYISLPSSAEKLNCYRGALAHAAADGKLSWKWDISLRPVHTPGNFT